MWYDKHTMRIIFYIGVMCILFGVGIWKLGYEIPGVILACIGAAAAVFGFKGIKMNAVVESQFRKKQKKRN